MSHITKKEGLLLLSLFGLGAWVYLRSLHGPFIVDDAHTVVLNFPLRNPLQIGEIMQQDLFAALGRQTSYFRPLTQLSFALDFRFWGLNPLGYRITNLTLHLVNTVLVFYLAKRYLSLAQSFLVSSFFVIHPVNMQAIAYISSRSDPLFFLFTVLTVLVWMTDKSTLRPVCLLSFLLGLLSKEPAAVTFPLLFLTDLARSESPKEIKDRLSANWPWYIGLAGVFLAYLVLRLWILKYPLLRETELKRLPISQRALLALTLLGKHLTLLVFPVNLAFVHFISLSLDPFGPEILGPLLVSIGLVYLALKLWHRQRAVAFGLGWFLVAIFPVLNLSPLNLPLMESWLYLPEVGFFVLIVSLFRLLVKPKALRIFAACVIVALLTMRAVVRSADWSDPVRLFEKNVELYPNSDIAWSALASAYGQVGSKEGSLEAIKKTIALKPYSWTSHLGLGMRYFFADADDNAEKEFLTAAKLAPDVAWPHYYLGISYVSSGLWKKALEEFKKASLAKPHIPMVYHLIGSTYLALGERGLAEEAFKRALMETPGNKEYHAGIHMELGSLLKRKGLLKEAKREFESALRFDPNNKQAKEKLASLK